MRLMARRPASARAISISLLHGASAAAPNQGATVDHYGHVVPDNPAGQASDRSTQRQVPVILAFGLKPERFVGQEGRIDAVLEPPAAEKADVLVQALASGIEASGDVIAVLPQWFPPEGALRLGMARSMLDTDRVAVHETALPPLAGAVLCIARVEPRAAHAERRACSPRCCPSSRPSCTSSPGSGPCPD